MKILVTGGNGFIGQEVCRIAVGDGHEVVGLARSGRPETPAPWADGVRWVAANVLDPEGWREHLEGCDAVVHCVGIAFEKPEKGATFERINGDAAEVASWEAEHVGVGRFVLISAAVKPPGLSPRFLSSKRRAESALRGRQLEESILRPGLVYGPGRPPSMVVGALLRGLGHVPGLKRRLRPNRPLHVDQVALAAVRAATEPGYQGVIDVDNIDYLAGEAWRAYAEADAGATSDVRPLVVGGAVAGLVGGALWALRSRR